MGSYNYYKMFGCFNRKFKMNDTGPPPDVKEAFSIYSETGTHLSADQLLRFLTNFQGEVGWTLSDAEKIMETVLHQRHHLIKYTRHYLALDDFFYFLFHDDLNPPIKSQVHHDMTAPLQHYFIYTGHNSYLTGNQLSSDCSDIPIINALERGVRGIELDLWPNSTKDEIHVLHGRTLTTPVRLDKCFTSIKQHAFVKSPYPVIVTLEDHLTPRLRAKVAEMAVRTFGELLYYPERGCFDEFPSPEELKHHIILSTKPPKEYLESKNLESKNSREREISGSPMERDFSVDDLLEKEKEKETSKLTCDLEADQETLQSNSDQDEDSDVHNSHTERQIGESELKHDQGKSNCELGDQDDEDLGPGSQKSSHQGGLAYKRLFAIQSADLRVEPPAELAEDNSLDNNESSKLGAPAEIAENRSKKSSELGAPEELAEDHGHKSNEIGAPDELAQDSTLDSHKSSQIGTPGYKRLFALQAADPRDDEDDLDVYTKRSCQLGITEHKRLGSLLQVDDWRSEDQANRDDDDGNKFPLTASAYKHLIAIHADKPKDGLRRTLLVGVDKVRRLSLSEQELERAAECYGTDIVRFTQKNIVRVYPKGTRVTSSNFKPLTGWMVGAQMVAFNMQGYGKSLWLMHGMFRANGGCGYVKKPEFLMKKGPHEVFDPKVTLPVKKTLKVKVYMGDGWRMDFSHTHFDTYSPPDFYTKIYIFGVPADMGKAKTKIIEDDWTPIWDEEFAFPLTVPELALLRIEVREYDRSDKDDFGGQTCLPVAELRPGIRSVPLYDKKGEKYRSVRLLMRFQFV